MSNKKVFLYVGNYAAGSSYPTLTGTDISGFEADEFVLTSGNYDNYLRSESERNEYMNQMVELARRVIQLTGKHVWFGLPKPPAPTSTITISEYSNYANQYLDMVLQIKSLIDAGNTDYYYYYVEGFYMNDEHVRRATYSVGGTDDPCGVNTNTSSLLQHPQIYMYNKVSQALMTSTYGWKKLLWCPYLGYGANYDTTMIDIAYIANTTNIFNTVLLQPNYYFRGDGGTLKNLDVIKNSMNRQEVRRRTNSGDTDTRVVAKTTSTIIGCQMELDPNCFTNNTFTQRYNTYVSKFSGSNISSAANRVFSYYCDQKNAYWTQTQQTVNSFFATL